MLLKTIQSFFNEKQERYYILDDIKKLNAQYNILLGGRNIGKSYAVKYDCIVEANENVNSQFGYIRRWGEDVKTIAVEEYFSDLNIKEITNNKYTQIHVWRGNIYFANFCEKTGRVQKGKKIGKIFSLASYERYKSRAFPEIKNVIFEEFITDSGYLIDEPRIFQNLISTIARDRELKAWLIGNTISKTCPYFSEWALINIPQQKVGTIDFYKMNGAETTISIAVDYIKNKSISKMAHGNVVASIVGDSWETREVAKLAGDIFDEHEVLHKVKVFFQLYKFDCFFLSNLDTDFVYWYVRPMSKREREVNQEVRTIICEMSPNPLFTEKFTPISQREKIAFDFLKFGKIYFSDNATGTEFLETYKYLK